MVTKINELLTMLFKAGPPGPPPRPGLEWKEETHRWVCPEEGCEIKHDHPDDGNAEQLLAVLSVPEQFEKVRQIMQLWETKDDEWIESNSDSITPNEGVWAIYSNFGYNQINSYIKAVKRGDEDSAEAEESSYYSYYASNSQQDDDEETDPNDDEETDPSKAITNTILGMQRAMKPLDSPLTVFRGLKRSIERPYVDEDSEEEDEEVQEGDVIEIDSFLSTSRGPKTPLSSDFAKHTLLVITAEAGIEATHLATLERETVFNYGQYLRIDEIRDVSLYGFDTQQVIKATVLPRSYKKNMGLKKAAPGLPLATLDRLLQIFKAGPPGPPPRPGLEWKEETRRWIRPKKKTVGKVKLQAETKSGLKSLSHALSSAKGHSAVDKALEYVAYGSEDFRFSMKGGLQPFTNRWLLKYTGSGYIEINNYLRTGERRGGYSTAVETIDDAKEAIQSIDSIMENIEEDQIVYRGVQHLLLDAKGNTIKEGGILPIESYLSTSRNPRMATTFAYRNTCTKGYGGYYIKLP